MKFLLILILATSSSYQAKIRKYEKELRKLHKELVQIQRQKKGVIRKIQIIDNQLDVLQEMLQAQKEHENNLRRSIKELKHDIDSLQTDLTYKQAVLKTYLVRLYKYGEPNLLEIVFAGRNPYESYRRAKIYNYILKKEKRLYEQVDADIKELKRKRELLRQQLVEIKKVEKSIAYRREQLARKKRQKRALLRKIKNKEELKKYRIRRLELAKKRLEELLKGIEKKQEKRKKVYVARSKGFIWPVRGKVIQKFGVVVHPKYGTKVNNIGIDIKARPGAEVVASKDGVVVYSGPFITYRGVVILEHGRVYTVYANLDKILVKRGQMVNQGEVIGELPPYDPVLHFEIRVRGRAVNPLKYLK